MGRWKVGRRLGAINHVYFKKKKKHESCCGPSQKYFQTINLLIIMDVVVASQTQQQKGVDNRWKKCAVSESSNPPYVMGRFEKKFNLQGPPQTSL